jgi:hypothetical protein
MGREPAELPASKGVKRAATLVTAVVFAGCSTSSPPPATIRASDTVTTYSGRLAAESRTDGRQPSDPGLGAALEINYLQGRGRDVQNLRAGEQPIQMSGATFNAPQTLNHDFGLKWIEFDARVRYFSPQPDRSLGVEVLGGLAFPRLNLRVSTPTRTAKETFGVGGPVVGLGLLWRFRPGTYAHGRWSAYGGVGGGDDDMRAQRYEIALAHAVHRNLVLRAGYNDVRMKISRNYSGFSDIDVRMRGPSLGLDAVF